LLFCTRQHRLALPAAALLGLALGLEQQRHGAFDVLAMQLGFFVEPQHQAILHHSTCCSSRSSGGQAADHQPHHQADNRQRQHHPREAFERTSGSGVECPSSSRLEPCMFHVILFQPEIPPNTGNVIRLCANSGCHLHLIEPMGFELDDKRLRRAGLDYHEYATLKRHETWPDAWKAWATRGCSPSPPRARGRSTMPFSRAMPSCSGRKAAACRPRCWTPAGRTTPAPADAPGCRSLNLSNTVAVTCTRLAAERVCRQPMRSLPARPLHSQQKKRP
jgi:tRNA (cytidine/uridine-2'-O-)-methyltransferase